MLCRHRSQICSESDELLNNWVRYVIPIWTVLRYNCKLVHRTHYILEGVKSDLFHFLDKIHISTPQAFHVMNVHLKTNICAVLSEYKKMIFFTAVFFFVKHYLLFKFAVEPWGAKDFLFFFLGPLLKVRAFFPLNTVLNMIYLRYDEKMVFSRRFVIRKYTEAIILMQKFHFEWLVA